MIKRLTTILLLSTVSLCASRYDDFDDHYGESFNLSSVASSSPSSEWSEDSSSSESRSRSDRGRRKNKRNHGKGKGKAKAKGNKQRKHRKH